MRKKRKYLLVVSWILPLLINSFLWTRTFAKGIGVIGKGGGSGEVCLDCAGNYTEDELKWSLIILSIILSVFLLILCSQCCSRLRARLSDDEKCSTIPAPVYRRNTERRIYRTHSGPLYRSI